MITYPPDSPNLAPSDFHTLGALKDAICGKMFESEGDVIYALSTWLYEQDKAWDQQGKKQTCLSLAQDSRSGSRLYGKNKVQSQTITLHNEPFS